MSDSSPFTCSICLENYNEINVPVTLSCGHSCCLSHVIHVPGAAPQIGHCHICRLNISPNAQLNTNYSLRDGAVLYFASKTPPKEETTIKELEDKYYYHFLGGSIEGDEELKAETISKFKNIISFMDDTEYNTVSDGFDDSWSFPKNLLNDVTSVLDEHYNCTIATPIESIEHLIACLKYLRVEFPVSCQPYTVYNDNRDKMNISKTLVTSLALECDEIAIGSSKFLCVDIDDYIFQCRKKLDIVASRTPNSFDKMAVFHYSRERDAHLNQIHVLKLLDSAFVTFGVRMCTDEELSVKIHRLVKISPWNQIEIVKRELTLSKAVDRIDKWTETDLEFESYCESFIDSIIGGTASHSFWSSSSSSIAMKRKRPDIINTSVTESNVWTCITPAQWERLAFRAGVIFCAPLLWDVMKDIATTFIKNVFHRSILLSAHRNTRLSRSLDVQRSLFDGYGIIVYGCGMDSLRDIWSSCIYKILKQTHPTLEMDNDAILVMNDFMTSIIHRLVDKGLAFSQSSICASIPNTSAHRDEDEDVYNSEDEATDRCFFNVHIDTECTATFAVYENDEVLDLFETQSEGSHFKVLTFRELQSAVMYMFPDVLAKHTVSEGKQAITKFNLLTYPWGNWSESAGLVVDPKVIGLIANRARGVVLTPNASILLAATVEYIAAEVLELCGNTCKTHKTSYITPRHVYLATSEDGELYELFLFSKHIHGCIKAGGVIPTFLSIHVLNESKEKLAAKPASKRSFSEVFRCALATTDHGILVDPRDGKHKCLVNRVIDGIDEESQVEEVVDVPELDKASRLNIDQRINAARAGLGTKHRQLMREEMASRTSDIVNVHHSRIECIKREKDRIDKILHPAIFAPLIRKISRGMKESDRDGYRDDLLTAEALEILHIATEGYLISLLHDANFTAVNAGRIIVFPKDVEITLRLRNERP